MRYRISGDLKNLNYMEHRKTIDYITAKRYDKLFGEKLNLPFQFEKGGGIWCIVHKSTWEKDIQVSFFVNDRVMSDRKFIHGELEFKKFIMSVNKYEFKYYSDMTG